MHVVIVGAGVTGLAASILLTRFGHTVAIAEKNARPAPLLRGFSRNGLHFDTGFHIAGGLEPGGVLHRWLQVLGVMPELRIKPLHPDSAFLLQFPDGVRRRMPYGFEAVIRMTAQDFPGHEHAVAALLRDMDAEMQTSPYMCPGHAAERLNAGSNTLVPGFASGDAVELGARLAALPPELATMLASFTLLYGVPPASGTWKQFSMVVTPFLRASHSLEGGGKSLAAALEKSARAAGVRFHCGQAVRRLDVSPDKTLRGVVLADGTSLACDLCLFTGHPAQLPELVGPQVLRPAYLHRIAELEETLSPLLLFASTRASFLDGHALYLLKEATPDSLFVPDEPGNQTAYLVCGDPHADGRRPLMAVTLCPALPEAPEAYQQAKARTAELFAASIRRRCPELDDLTVLETATPASMRRWVYGSSGSLYGVLHGRQCAELQPTTRIRGLLLAGQNILLPGVLGCIISAAVTVGLVATHKAVFEECARWAENA